MAAGDYSASLPLVASGTFGDAEGAIGGANNFYSDIYSTNTQGLGADDYTSSISLLKNKDLYNYNVLALPGLISNISAKHNEVIDFATSLISLGDESDVPPNFNTSFKSVYLF